MKKIKLHLILITILISVSSLMAQDSWGQFEKVQYESTSEITIVLLQDILSSAYMMNAIGETKYNSLPVLFFNLPNTMPISKNSYSANESMYPADYIEGLQSVNKPLLVFVGSDDEVFNAGKYQTSGTKNS